MKGLLFFCEEHQLYLDRLVDLILFSKAHIKA